MLLLINPKNPAACKDLIIAFASGPTPTAFSVYSVMTKSDLIFMIVAYQPSFTDASCSITQYPRTAYYLY